MNLIKKFTFVDWLNNPIKINIDTLCMFLLYYCQMVGKSSGDSII